MRTSKNFMLTKKTRLLKKALCLFFVILFCINSFASVISDNDGAAFITNELSAYLIQFNFSKMKIYTL